MGTRRLDERAAGGLDIGGAAPDVETASDAYAERFSGKIGAYLLGVQEAGALNLIFPWKGGKILDVGGGHAQLAPRFVREGYRVTVTGSTRACRHRLDPLVSDGSVVFRVCHFMELPYPDRSFDAVVSFRLLSHVREWPSLIAELCRVAKHAVVLDYPDVCSANLLADKMFGLKKAVEKNTRAFLCFRRSEILDAFAAQGFEVASVFPQFFFPMALHRAMRSPTVSHLLEGGARVCGLTRFFGSPVIMRATREHAD